MLVGAAALLALGAACGGEGKERLLADAACAGGGQMETAYLEGSAEHPDPVLEEVLRLQEAGEVREVAIMESFPVQIQLTACPRIIRRLEEMPRKAE